MWQFYADYAVITGRLWNWRLRPSINARIIRLLKTPDCFEKFVRFPVPYAPRDGNWTFRNLAEVGRISRDDSARIDNAALGGSERYTYLPWMVIRPRYRRAGWRLPGTPECKIYVNSPFSPPRICLDSARTGNSRSTLFPHGRILLRLFLFLSPRARNRNSLITRVNKLRVVRRIRYRLALLIPRIALQSDCYNENFNRVYCNA